MYAVWDMLSYLVLVRLHNSYWYVVFLVHGISE